MKVSKSILAAVIAGSALAGSVSSCSKERVEKTENEREENIPFCGFGETPDTTANVNCEDCPACGRG